MSQIRPASVDELEIPAALQTPEVIAALSEWLEYRKEARHKPWLARTWSVTLRKYEQRPRELVAAIENSIGNGYQGLFEPRVSNYGGYASRQHDLSIPGGW